MVRRVSAGWKPRGCVRFFDVRGAPVYLHLSIPIALAVVAIASRLQWKPLAWIVGFATVILVHELGHAALLWRFRIPVIYIYVHPLGGQCAFADWATPWQRALVAWGGVLGQLLLFAVVCLAGALSILPRWMFTTNVVYVLTGINLFVAVLNLLPIPPLDGRDAWRIVRLGYLRAKRSWLKHRLLRLQQTASSEREIRH